MLNGIVAACMISAMGLATPTAPVARQSDKTIVRLVGQRGAITISSTAGGPRYSASDARGGSICTNLTIEQLRANQPEIYKQVNPAICVDADTGIMAAVDTR
jgi:hypothetical protein